MNVNKIGVVIVISLLIIVLFASSVNATISLGFKRSDNLCGNSGGVANIADYSSSFSTAFGGYLSDGQISIPVSQFIYGMVRTIGTIENTCLADGEGTRADVGEHLGMFGYAYVYTATPLDTIKYKLYSYTDTNANNDKNWLTYSVLELYNISNLDKSISSMSTLLKSSTPPIKSCFPLDPLKDNDNGDSKNKATTKEYPCDLQTLSSGVYFLAIGVVGTPEESMTGNSRQIESSFWLPKFNNQESDYASNMEDDDPNYLISYTPLSQTEINDRFGDAVETSKGLCLAAGGDFNGTVPDGIPSCCGNDPSDYGSNKENYIYEDPNNAGEYYFCTEDGWDYKSYETRCTESDEEGCVYEAAANEVTDWYAWDAVENGSDGCCGDDLPVYCELKEGISCGDINDDNTCSDFDCTWEPNYCDGTLICEVYSDTNIEGMCSGNAPRPECETNCVKNDDGSRNCDCVPRDSGSNPVCKDLFASHGICYTEAGCVEEPLSIGTCTGTISDNVCENNCDNTDFCKLKDNPIYGDAAYVSGNGAQFFCNKDLNKYTSFLLPGNAPSSTWKWWNAQGYKIPFTIHEFNNVDYISNSEQWFYCDTGKKEIKTNAIPIEEEGTFTLSDGGAFTCVETLNEFLDVIKNIDPSFDYLSGFHEGTYFRKCKPYDDNDPKNYNLSYCCITEDGSIATYEQNSFEDGCGSVCYLDTGRNLENTMFVRGTLERSNFTYYYCQKYPWDDLCSAEDITLGNLFPPENDEFFEKTSCEFSLTGCLGEGINTNMPCGDINVNLADYPYDFNGQQLTSYVGVGCDFEYKQGQYESCVTGLYVNATDVGEENTYQSCCLVPKQYDYLQDEACLPIEAQMTAGVCAELGGDYFADWTDEEYQGNAGGPKCISPVGNFEGCCIAGKWFFDWKATAFAGLTQPNMFICYQHGNEQRMAECCTEQTPCNNYENNGERLAMFQSVEKDPAYNTKGVSIHSLQSFDKFASDGEGNPLKLVDFVKKFAFNNDKIKREILNFDGLVLRENYDWSSFKYLELDVAYNLDELSKVIIYDDKKAHNCTFDFSSHLINGKKTMRWHHFILDFKNSNEQLTCDQSMDWSTVDSIVLERHLPSTGNSFAILLDNIRLSGGEINTKDYYCTGNFGSWISNLDGPNNEDGSSNDKGFVGVNPLKFTDYGPYWYACESQASFDWSGRLCCGDDTSIPYNEDIATQNNAEYYADDRMGCFGGNPVYNNWRVGDTLNDPTYNGLMFFNGKFFGCEALSEYNYGNLVVNYDGQNKKTDPLVSAFNRSYTIIGDWICDPSGDWVPLDSVSKAKLIASKLYNLTFLDSGNNLVQYSKYDLICDTFDFASPYFDANQLLQENDLSYMVDNNIKQGKISDFCTLKYGEDKTYSISGFGLNVPISNFLNGTNGDGLITHLTLLDPTLLENNPNFANEVSNACLGMNTGYSSNDHFFKVCDPINLGGGQKLRMAYNPDIKILFVAYAKNENEFKELFESVENDKSIEQFFENMINVFSGIFRNWFKVKDNGKAEFMITPNSTLPLVNENIVNYKKVFLSGKGTKKITGLYFSKDVVGSSFESSNSSLSIEYIGFESSVFNLAEAYYNNKPYSLNYIIGDNKQVINLQEPVKQFGEHSGFEDDFDWRTLTTMLDIDLVETSGNLFSGKHHNFVVDLDELCDTDLSGENELFRYRNNSCIFWNKTFNYGNVTCNSDYTINYNNCLVNEPSNE